MKIFIKTYGCQANINDSEILAAQFKKQGYQLTNSEKTADLIFINSCSVKNKTQSKTLHYIKKYYSSKKIIVGGCLIKTLDLKKQFLKLIIKDTKNIQRLGNPLIRKNKEIAIIQISQGCLNNCTYCATKLAKGKLKSYPVSKIKKQLEKSIKDKCKIIYLTSQDNSCYGFDLRPKTNLAKLLEELIKVQGNYKIRVGMAHPGHLKKYFEELLEVMICEKIQKFLHIPVQSGSNKILKEMKRGHTVKDFEKIVLEFRKNFPEITISTDIIVGYPTETEKDFQMTLKLVEKIKPEVLNISGFSSRPRTEASKLKQLASEIIKERTRKLDRIYENYRQNI
ncbi:MAG: MiaB/RimO family radical SAM methylthiotransferase [Nanoarchaeota archaeon]|nr:MiaB/RimO family radical SAM methylthiotransferase [Nanoarchaeota archaeon]